MNIKSIGFLAILASAIIFVSCGKNDTAQPPPASPPRPQRITIKGFYIGMPENEIVSVAKDSFAKVNLAGTCEDFKLVRKGEYNEYDADFSLLGGVIATSYEYKFGMSTVRLIMDEQNKLRLMIIPRLAGDVLFNSSTLNTEEFVQKIANAYHIPEFKHRSDTEGYWTWEYVSPDDIGITISDSKDHEKELSIYKCKVSQKDINKSFN